MVRDLRIRLAAGLLLGVAALLGGTQAFAADSLEVQYRCGGTSELVIRRTHAVADARFEERTYRLHRKASSLGERYSGANAAIIVDGATAVFVAGDQVRVHSCVESGRIPQAG